jgi:methyl-accepting chemotaxis protein
MFHLLQAIYHPRLAIRLQLIAFTALLCLAVLANLAIVESYNLMSNTRVHLLRAMTEQAISISSALEQRVQTGNLTREQAIQQYRDAIRPIRCDAGAGYYFDYSMDGTTLVLGPSPEVEGTSRIGLKDADGTLLVQAMIEAGRQGGGTVVYRYPKARIDVLQPKLVYVQSIPAWNMVVGTGLYIDDLQTAAIAAIGRLGVVVGVLLSMCIAVAWAVSRSITRPLSQLRRSMASLAKGDLATAVAVTNRKDEIGDMAGAVLIFKEYMVKADYLATARETDTQRSAAEKQAALNGMADRIEAETATALHAVAARTTAMTETAQEMSASAARTGQSARWSLTRSHRGRGIMSVDERDRPLLTG